MSIGKNSLVNLLGNVLPMGIAIVTVPLYLSYIGTERYGVLAVIWSLLGYFGFIDLGLGRAVAQRMARLSNASAFERSKLLWTGLISTFLLGVVGSLLLWQMADFILSHVMKMSLSSRDEASNTVIWLLLVLPIVLISSVLQGALQARLRFVELNGTQVLGSTLSQLLPLGVAMSGHTNLEYLVPAALLSRLVTSGLMLKYCQIYVPLVGQPCLDWSHLNSMMRYGGWLSVMSILAPLLVTIDRLVIATLSGAKSVAYYTVPYDLVIKTMVVSGSVSGAIFPRLAAVHETEARDLALRATTVLMAIMTPVVIVGILVAHPFLILWVGQAFAEKSAGVPEIILIGVWLNALVIPLQARLLAASNPKVVVKIYLIQIPIYLLMMWGGLIYWGIVGAAAAWSTRVLIDDAMLLYAGKALWHTIQAAIPSFVIIFAVAVIAMITDWQDVSRWIFGTLLLVLALIKDKRPLVDAINSLRSRTLLVTR